MDNNLTTALVSAGSSVVIAITALVLNHRGFASLETRMLALENRVDARLNLMQSALNLMQADMKDLNKTMSAIEVDVARLKDKVGM